MGTIVWDPQALEQVHEIYDYYYEHMSPQVAYDLLCRLLPGDRVKPSWYWNHPIITRWYQ